MTMSSKQSYKGNIFRWPRQNNDELFSIGHMLT